MQSRYKPNVTVACIIQCHGKYLLVKELIDGNIRYNQPAGHLEANESLLKACIREVYEETGIDIAPAGLVGIYQFQAEPELAFLRFTFSAELNELSVTAPQDPQIISADWYSYPEIMAMSKQLRSPLVLKSIQDYQLGIIHQLSIFNDDYLIAQPRNA